MKIIVIINKRKNENYLMKYACDDLIAQCMMTHQTREMCSHLGNKRRLWVPVW